MPPIQVQQKRPVPIEEPEVLIPEEVVKREESEVMEDEFAMVIATEPMSDDPFIIIRKTTSKKSNIQDIQVPNQANQR